MSLVNGDAARDRPISASDLFDAFVTNGVKPPPQTITFAIDTDDGKCVTLHVPPTGRGEIRATVGEREGKEEAPIDLAGRPVRRRRWKEIFAILGPPNEAPAPDAPFAKHKWACGSEAGATPFRSSPDNRDDDTKFDWLLCAEHRGPRA